MSLLKENCTEECLNFSVTFSPLDIFWESEIYHLFFPGPIDRQQDSLAVLQIGIILCCVLEQQTKT